MPVSTCKRLAALSATAVVVDTVEPAHLDLKVEVFDSSTVNVSGGRILDDLW
ncbi:MAG: hypothetical protein GTN77_00405, partial [Planctomycetales bacterium]|nr:hypothetical protein [Planctomycetales bacterium]